jgi:hypothetical protein
MTQPSFTQADRDYVRTNFFVLEELCGDRSEDPAEVTRLIDAGLLPQPSYVVDGRAMFPADYFDLYDEAGGTDRLRQLFEDRYRTAARDHPQLATADSVKAAWRAYLGGVWGQCLRQVTPETIVRKRALVDSLCKLIALPRPGSADWKARLRAEVDELDELEREFAPDYDRAPDWNERPPTRDLLIEVTRERFPDVFADRHMAVGAR